MERDLFFFRGFFPKSAKVIVDIGGYCGFVNNINYDCRKMVLDLNPNAKVYAKNGVEVMIEDFGNLPQYVEKYSFNFL